MSPHIRALLGLVSKERLAAIALIVVIAAAAREGRHRYDVWWHQRFLPAKIEFDSMIFGRRDNDCGAAVFRLSDATTEIIKREGLAFFDDEDTRRPRGIQRWYAVWRETPFPQEPGMRVEVPWRGLRCTRTHGTDFDPLIDHAYLAAYKSGSYFTTQGTAMLLVSPWKRMVVLPYVLW